MSCPYDVTPTKIIRHDSQIQGEGWIDFATTFQYPYPVNYNVQKTKQACLCCTCCMCVSSGAGT